MVFVQETNEKYSNYPLPPNMSSSCCPCCSFRCPTKYQLLKHLFESHSGNKDFKICCPGNECPRLFVTFSSLLSHANRKHPLWKEQLESSGRLILFGDSNHENNDSDPDGSSHNDPDGSSHNDPDGSSHNDPDGSSHNDPDGSSHNDPDGSSHNDNDANSRNPTDDNGAGGSSNTSIVTSHSQVIAAKFLLTLKEQYRIPQTALDFTINAVKDIVSAHSSGVSVSSTIADHCDESLNPFEGVETEHMQTKFFKERFGLVVGA